MIQTQATRRRRSSKPARPIRPSAAVAGSGLESLFPAGTAQGRGWRETTVRQTIWSDAATFRALNEEFAREAAELARVAAAADATAVRAQFQKVARTCKSCHDKFRQTD